MDWLTTLYPKIKEYLLSQLPPYWPQLYQLGDNWFDSKIIPEIIPVLASCKAVGGNPENTISLCSALLATAISIRILDDLQDQDKPNALHVVIGSNSALNCADAFKTLAFKILGEVALNNKNLGQEIYQTYIDTYFLMLAGQERDLTGMSKTWEDYWQTVEMKTGYSYATAATLGAMMGTDNQQLIQVCKVYGYHLGLAIQIFNDLEGIWHPAGKSDLKQGKVTLPLLYGLQCEHPDKEELLSIVEQNKIKLNATRIKEILEKIDAKSYLVWLALQHRDCALQAMAICPDEEGKQALEYRFTTMYGDLEKLIEQPDFATEKDNNSPYQSIGLNLRNQLRNPV